MDRNQILAVILLLLIVADVSNASPLLSNFRRFVTLASTASSNSNQISPSPSLDPVHTSANTASRNTSSNDIKVDNSSNGSNHTSTAPPPPPLGNEKKGGKSKTKTDSESDVGLNCTGFPRRCSDGNNLVACILNVETEHKKFVVLAQNEGESNIYIDLSAPDTANRTSLELPKQKSREITLLFSNSNEVILKSRYGECILHLDLPASKGNFFLYLPSYDKLVTPINGAYFLIISVLIFGGISICYLFRKKRWQEGIPYQELEMGLPESSLSNTVETAEGWDEGWDDDWDEENAVKSQHTGNISANGLTSRTPNKAEWENDWDE